MLLTGTHERTLDEKKRLALPRKIRECMRDPDMVYITPGPDQCLWVFTRESLESLASRLDKVPATDAEARVFRRLYFAQTESADLDRAGRMLIPDRLVGFAGLGREVVLIGVQDHLELWDAERWKKYLEEHAPRFDAVAESAFQEK